MRSTGKYYMNADLYDYAKKSGFFLPTKHFISVVDLKKLDNDFQKFHNHYHWFPDDKAFRLAVAAFRRIYDPVINSCKPISFDEAVRRAEKSTSPGFLYKKEGHFTKGDVLRRYHKTGQEEMALIDTPTPYDLMKQKVEAVFAGVDVETIWETSPKVEVRPIDKVFNINPDKEKQRTFLTMDTLAYIVALMLYSEQNDAMVKLAGTNHWSAVGSSIFHGGWDNLVNTVCRNPACKGNVICTDVSHMEASLNDNILLEIYKWRNAPLATHSQTYHATAWFVRNKIYAKVLDPHGFLGVKIGVNPSGCLNTLEDNGKALTLVMLYHLAKILIKRHPNDTFNQLLDKLVYLYDTLPVKNMGDDNIMAYLDIWLETIGESKMSQDERVGLFESADDLGFEFTFETDAPTPINKAKFLNFGFAYNANHGMWTFVPNYDKMFANLFFNRKSDSWRLTLAKLNALRVMCFSDLNRRFELESYISYVWNNHDNDMKKETAFEAKLPYAALRTMYLPKHEIEFLIYGLEGKVSDQHDAALRMMEYGEENY